MYRTGDTEDGYTKERMLLDKLLR